MPIDTISCCLFCITGIFAYLNYLTPKTRREILDHLIAGLKRQEYRGYDSAGVAFDSVDGKNTILVRRSGKVDVLVEAIAESMFAVCCIRCSVYFIYQQL